MAARPGKGRRQKMARDIRRALGTYLLFQQAHVQQAHPDHEDIAWDKLCSARELLDALMTDEAASREGS